jgi:type II secretory pathway pseudopilin PulG
MKTKTNPSPYDRQMQLGMSLLETVIALGILLVVTVGVMSVATIAIETTENQGHLQARAAEYAQDKMEQLISLSYGDPSTDTTQFPSTNTGGSGLTVGGSSDPSSAVTTPGTGYVDYLDRSGAISLATGNWYYIRVWKIENPSTNLKRITVTTQVRSAVGAGGTGLIPQATVVSLKTFPF